MVRNKECMQNKTLIFLGLGILGVAIFSYATYGVLSGEKDSLSFRGQYGKGKGGQEQLEQKRMAPIEEVTYQIDGDDFVSGNNLIKDLPVSESLTDEEKAGLLLMREEEKLARDVYEALARTSGVRIFSNIANSEATHMASVGDLLVRYELTDPIVDDVRGVFANPDLQKLYNELVTRGQSSVTEAFRVGALIEDLDIYDLENLLAKTNKADIITVYKNLQKGSRNHLRAFSRQIVSGGDTYTPSYISELEYQSIIGNEQERGRM